jgi:hypothetical protein
MSQPNEQISQRFGELLQQSKSIPYGDREAHSAEPGAFYAWASSVLNLFHGVFGPSSPQFLRFHAELESISNNYVPNRLFEACKGMFRGAKSDYEGGYLFHVERALAGELFGDLVALAKASLAEGYHTVALVLACAALEDALKRYAAMHELSVEDATMEQVVNALKTKGLVSGPQKGLLAAMPKVRNHAMHADWEKLTPQDAGSVIGFVEHFLLINFS